MLDASQTLACHCGGRTRLRWDHAAVAGYAHWPTALRHRTRIATGLAPMCCRPVWLRHFGV
jgi:hypothetical protein